MICNDFDSDLLNQVNLNLESVQEYSQDAYEDHTIVWLSCTSFPCCG